MALVYDVAKYQMLKGTRDFTATTIKAMLVTSSYVASAAHTVVTSGSPSPAGAELSGTGYVAGFGGAGRLALASKTVTQDDSLTRAYFNAANLTWTAINAGTARAVILFEEITSDALSPLIGYLDTGGFPVTTNGGNLVIAWSTSPAGILQVS